MVSFLAIKRARSSSLPPIAAGAYPSDAVCDLHATAAATDCSFALGGDVFRSVTTVWKMVTAVRSPCKLTLVLRTNNFPVVGKQR